MSTDLSDYVGTLRRAVTPLGSTLYSTITDTQLVPYMTDAFWEARLDGFMPDYVADEDGVVTNTTGGADLDQRGVALIVLYAGISILRSQILNTKTGFRAKAGPVEYEEENSATVLAEMLKQLRAAKDRVLEELDELVDQTPTLYIDAFSTRLFSVDSYWGSPELTGG